MAARECVIAASFLLAFLTTASLAQKPRSPTSPKPSKSESSIELERSSEGDSPLSGYVGNQLESPITVRLKGVDRKKCERSIVAFVAYVGATAALTPAPARWAGAGSCIADAAWQLGNEVGDQYLLVYVTDTDKGILSNVLRYHAIARALELERSSEGDSTRSGYVGNQLDSLIKVRLRGVDERKKCERWIVAFVAYVEATAAPTPAPARWDNAGSCIADAAWQLGKDVGDQYLLVYVTDTNKGILSNVLRYRARARAPSPSQYVLQPIRDSLHPIGESAPSGYVGQVLEQPLRVRITLRDSVPHLDRDTCATLTVAFTSYAEATVAPSLAPARWETAGKGSCVADATWQLGKDPGLQYLLAAVTDCGGKRVRSNTVSYSAVARAPSPSQYLLIPLDDSSRWGYAGRVLGKPIRVAIKIKVDSVKTTDVHPDTCTNLTVTFTPYAEATVAPSPAPARWVAQKGTWSCEAEATWQLGKDAGRQYLLAAVTDSGGKRVRSTALHYTATARALPAVVFGLALVPSAFDLDSLHLPDSTFKAEAARRTVQGQLIVGAEFPLPVLKIPILSFLTERPRYFFATSTANPGKELFFGLSVAPLISGILNKWTGLESYSVEDFPFQITVGARWQHVRHFNKDSVNTSASNIRFFVGATSSVDVLSHLLKG